MADTSKPKARPDDWEWANAPLRVTRVRPPWKKGTVVYRLQKTIHRGRTRFTQLVWINQHQLEAMARDHATAKSSDP